MYRMYLAVTIVALIVTMSFVEEKHPAMAIGLFVLVIVDVTLFLLSFL